MLDVLVAGAGPAGAIAARELARAGARVLIVDRDEFPRKKLCGDTLNPGALRLLASLSLTGGALDAALPLDGMRVTGPGASVEARYGTGTHGAALSRQVFDAWLLEQAIAAGARFEPGLSVQAALTSNEQGTTIVRGLVLKNAKGQTVRVPAPVTIGADGRRSAVARSVGLSSQPAHRRRWAYGGYFARTAAAATAETVVGEMHVRHGWYCGVAPLPDGRINLCVVTDRREGAADPLGLIRHYLARDPELHRRFGEAECTTPVSVLGPLAVDVTSAAMPGLMLAGDAAGFVDPMTGDGLNLAMRGATLAAAEALRVLESGDWDLAVRRLNTERARVLGAKLTFNRALRRLTSSAGSLVAASLAARLAPSLIRSLIVRAGDAA